MLDTLLLLLQVLGALGIFIFGMKLMSESILKLSGEKLRAIMGSMTTNRFAGILTGFFITCLVQSSSATTVMVVSFVHAQLLTLTQSIGVIMGANLGTTITAWIVSLFGFKFKVTAIAVPIIGIGVALSFLKGVKLRHLGGFLTGFGFASIIIFVFLGSLLTVVVQSSSAAMAITLTMANLGWLDFEQSIAIILGENIGTTITAWLAALPANTAAKRAARAHFMFNIIGVCWVLIVIGPFSGFIHWLYDFSTSFLPWEKLGSERTDLTNKLALFHTTFNFFNILLLVGFVPQIGKLVTRMVKEKESAKGSTYKYLHSYNLRAGELNFQEATRAVQKLGNITLRMFEKFIEVYEHPEQDMSTQVKELKALEKESNLLTDELTEYLIRCTSDEVSDETRERAFSYMRVAAELEEIGDCCHRMTNRAVRRYKKNRLVTETAEKEVIQFGKLVHRFIELYSSKLDSDVSAADMEMTLDFEKAINEKRKELRKRSVGRMMESPDNVKGELLYFDIVNTFERIANHARNIMQSLPKQES